MNESFVCVRESVCAVCVTHCLTLWQKGKRCNKQEESEDGDDFSVADSESESSSGEDEELMERIKHLSPEEIFRMFDTDGSGEVRAAAPARPGVARVRTCLAWGFPPGVRAAVPSPRQRETKVV